MTVYHTTLAVLVVKFWKVGIMSSWSSVGLSFTLCRSLVDSHK